MDNKNSFDWDALREVLGKSLMKKGTVTVVIPNQPLPGVLRSVTEGVNQRFDCDPANDYSSIIAKE